MVIHSFILLIDSVIRLYFKIPIAADKGGSGLMVYSKVSAKNDILERQRLRNQLLRNERDKLLKQAESQKPAKTQREIDILHRYNEIKDTAHELIGALNGMRGTTSTDLYEEFGLNLDD